ncbi:MAG: hypothetical protein HYZ20_08730 [Burkholderiales bacterium]|nr:hypothetical protein [Burkholderiales bacterium]
MKTRRPFLSLAAAVAAALSFTLAGCGGGNGEPPPDDTITDVVPVVPVVTITNNVVAETATGAITFTFSFNVDVGTSFTVDDVTVVDGSKGAFTRLSGSQATLVVTPPADAVGLVVVSVAAGAVNDATGAVNEAVMVQKAFDTSVVTPPPGGDTLLADFDAALPPVAGFEGAEGSAVVPCPAGGGTGNCFMVLRSGGQVFALGIVETTVPVTATKRTISAKVFSPTAGIPMVLKIEGPGGANSGDVVPNEAVVAGWQTLTWTFAGVDPALTFNKIVLLPNLGAVDAPPGKSYYFDDMKLVEASAPPPPSGTVLANFDDVLPPVAGFEGAEGSAVGPCPAGGGTGNCFNVLRSGGQVFALGIIEATVPVTATRRTISAQVFSPTAGIPMVLKIEGPGGANSGDVAANEAVVAGWQTLTWTFTGIDLSKTYNKMVLLPNLGTVDAPPGKAYYFDDIVLLGAAGGGSGPLTFSSGFAGGNRTVEGGEFGGFSGSNLDGFGCNGLPENCGGGGDMTPAVAAADSFFYYYYQTAVPAEALYAGIYVQAPGVTGGLSATADTPGLQLAGQTQIKFNFNPNPEWFGTATNNFMVQFDMGKLYDTGGPCHIQLRKVVTPTSAGQAAYALDLDSFAVVQNCGVAGLTAASVLATQPISQVSFQAAGGGAAVSDGTKTTGANLSAPNGAGVYPTTLVIKGGILFE